MNARRFKNNWRFNNTLFRNVLVLFFSLLRKRLIVLCLLVLVFEKEGKKGIGFYIPHPPHLFAGEFSLSTKTSNIVVGVPGKFSRFFRGEVFYVVEKDTCWHEVANTNYLYSTVLFVKDIYYFVF